MATKRRAGGRAPMTRAERKAVLAQAVELGREDKRIAALRTLAELRGERARLDQEMVGAVQDAREAGASWEQVGKFAGLTGEGSRRKWASQAG